MSNYHETFQKAEAKRREGRARLPEGLKVQRRAQSSLDTPVYRFCRAFFFAIIALGCTATVILFVRSFMSEKTPAEVANSAANSAYTDVKVEIGFKPEKR